MIKPLKIHFKKNPAEHCWLCRKYNTAFHIPDFRRNKKMTAFFNRIVKIGSASGNSKRMQNPVYHIIQFVNPIFKAITIINNRWHAITIRKTPLQKRHPDKHLPCQIRRGKGAARPLSA
jgi:hypothetical protein